MEIEELRRHWDGLGKEDPLWAILTAPDKAGGRWNVEEFFATGRQQVDAIFQQLEALGVRMQLGRALDFGCGVGRLAQALADRFDSVDGVDIASSMISLAEQYNRCGDRCRYHLNEEDNLSRFADGTFSFVLTLICLQHMEPRYARRYIAEFARILAPGGVLYFQLPATMTWVARARRALGAAAWRLGLAPSLRPLLRRWQKSQPEPSKYVMEMFAEPVSEVTAYLEGVGFRVLSAERDHFAGRDFVGYRYVAMRK